MKNFFKKHDWLIPVVLVIMLVLSVGYHLHNVWMMSSKPVQPIDLPEEIGLAVKGDTLYINVDWHVTTIGFKPIDDSDRIYIVK
jgi:hypothetical protein